MLKGIERLRDCAKRHAITVSFDKTELLDQLDAIEREVDERYVEGPTDKNGDPITYDTMIEQWGVLDYIGCKMLPDGTYEWLVRGHDLSAPVLSADEVSIVKPLTVEDVLNELCTKAFHSRQHDAHVRYKDVIAEYAKRLQLREE